MAADESPTPTSAAERELAEQHRTTMARTADLVCKLTALADRYEAAIVDGDARAADSRLRVALMRTTAEAGHQLLASIAPPVAPPAQVPTSTQELVDRARGKEVHPSGRDAAAEVRDERPAEPDRCLAAGDRDAAAGDRAGDRADALADRRAARADRELAAPRLALDTQARTYALVTRLEERAVVRQAQGILMHRAGLTAGQAFEALALAAAHPLTLHGVAEHVVRTSQLPAPPGAGPGPPDPEQQAATPS